MHWSDHEAHPVVAQSLGGQSDERGHCGNLFTSTHLAKFFFALEASTALVVSLALPMPGADFKNFNHVSTSACEYGDPFEEAANLPRHTERPPSTGISMPVKNLTASLAK
jgi:hypothetical protein